MTEPSGNRKARALHWHRRFYPTWNRMLHSLARVSRRRDSHVEVSSQHPSLRAHGMHLRVVFGRAPTVAFLALLSQRLHNPRCFGSTRSDTSTGSPRSYLRISIGVDRCLRPKVSMVSLGFLRFVSMGRRSRSKEKMGSNPTGVPWDWRRGSNEKGDCIDENVWMEHERRSRTPPRSHQPSD